MGFERLDEFLNQVFRRRCAGGDRDRLNTFQPGRIHFGIVVHQIGGHAFVLADFHQAARIRTVLRANHQQYVRKWHDGFDAQLPVLVA